MKSPSQFSEEEYDPSFGISSSIKDLIDETVCFMENKETAKNMNPENILCILEKEKQTDKELDITKLYFEDFLEYPEKIESVSAEIQHNITFMSRVLDSNSECIKRADPEILKDKDYICKLVTKCDSLMLELPDDLWLDKDVIMSDLKAHPNHIERFNENHWWSLPENLLGTKEVSEFIHSIDRDDVHYCRDYFLNKLKKKTEDQKFEKEMIMKGRGITEEEYDRECWNSLSDWAEQDRRCGQK